jgi:hypothetical protein
MGVETHVTHCCKLHGCKYGDKDCPVENGELEQKYLCEYCSMDNITSLEEMNGVFNNQVKTCPNCGYVVRRQEMNDDWGNEFFEQLEKEGDAEKEEKLKLDKAYALIAKQQMEIEELKEKIKEQDEIMDEIYKILWRPEQWSIKAEEFPKVAMTAIVRCRNMLER